MKCRTRPDLVSICIWSPKRGKRWPQASSSKRPQSKILKNFEGSPRNSRKGGKGANETIHKALQKLQLAAGTNANLPALRPEKASACWLASFEPRNPKPHERLAKMQKGTRGICILALAFLGFPLSLLPLFSFVFSAGWLAGFWGFLPSNFHTHLHLRPEPFIIYYDTNHT